MNLSGKLTCDTWQELLGGKTEGSKAMSKGCGYRFHSFSRKFLYSQIQVTCTKKTKQSATQDILHCIFMLSIEIIFLLLFYIYIYIQVSAWGGGGRCVRVCLCVCDHFGTEVTFYSCDMVTYVTDDNESSYRPLTYCYMFIMYINFLHLIPVWLLVILK